MKWIKRWWTHRTWLSLAYGPVFVALGAHWDDNFLLVLGGIMVGGDLSALVRDGWRPVGSLARSTYTTKEFSGDGQIVFGPDGKPWTTEKKGPAR